MASDEVIAALDDLLEAIEQNTARNKAIAARARRIKRQRARDLSYSQIVANGEKPLIVELITENLAALTDAGTRFRREEARALHEEGVTMERIAELFGVTRQRVSALLARTNGKSKKPKEEPSGD